jgi:hypothetical protein
MDGLQVNYVKSKEIVLQLIIITSKNIKSTKQPGQQGYNKQLGWQSLRLHDMV